MFSRSLSFAMLLSVVSSLPYAYPQAAYNPGQTFSTQPSQPAAQRPVYTPTPAPRAVTVTPAARPVERTNTQSVDSPLYNMSKKTPTPAVEKRASAPSRTLSVKAQKKSEGSEQTVKPVAEIPVKAVEKPVGTPEPVANKLVINSRRTGKKWVALTYDDGPNPSYTKDFAEFLVANKIPATFFLCGNMVKQYPDTVKFLADNNFELANHSYDHPLLTKLSAEKVTDQLQDTHDLIKSASGVDVKLMRPPFGAHNKTVQDVCEKMGYKIIIWDVDTEDWRKRSVPQMVNTIMKQTRDGSIILMHDRKHGGVDSVKETTRQVVEKLRADGYTFVTVGEMLSVDDGSAAGVTIGAVGAAVANPLVTSNIDAATSNPVILPGM